MPKSGLHKQISSIFDGEPASGHAPRPGQSIQQRLADADSSISVKTHTAEGSAKSSTGDTPGGRPKPAPRAAFKTPVKKKTVNAKKKNVDDEAAKRQKKMTVMVGVLSVVFIAVMIISFGGVGQTQAGAAAGEDKTSAAAPAPRMDPRNWQTPDPLPALSRDPMLKAQVAYAADGQTQDHTADQKLTVRGIVYSEQRPSAIVNDEIVGVGDRVAGVLVRAITRDAVEFENDDSRWTQHVEN